ncbi:DUF2871 domain-containing protein [Falsarthrobacter nasiphocae]|uniref:Type III secretory pathway component EscU n=1 Tax=Falsarthrobacter nasiphocae TaxID=189863 RepID=A0AAE3YF60_9MICC|nr:DUF2871 domain-containing protein [Falsarthrobacter nasiphocae]MDR6892274.1 type III secretory pathway component EscU [Falsarthrobacter nasiphocae]
MRKLFTSAALYATLGLLAGLFYREFTKSRGFTGETMLSVVHTHALALGMIVFLVALALDKVFDLSSAQSPAKTLFSLFFWFYNAGLLVTLTMLTTHGVMQVLGVHASAAVSGIAGLGHIALTIGIVHLFLALNKAMKHGQEPVRH